MPVTSKQLNIKAKRDDSLELSRYFIWKMKPLRVFLLSFVFLCVGLIAFTHTLIIYYVATIIDSTHERQKSNNL
jgi:Na+/melibiose symporter-like transporter